MRHHVGIDLHSNNTCCLITDEAGRWILKRKLKNDIDTIVTTLNPYKESIEGIAVEATYNWYWLVDGLMAAGYKINLAHPGKLGNHNGKKHTNDFDDAFELAKLLKNGELPPAYIYPKEKRPLRDLLRKRAFLVRNQTRHLLSLNNLISRNKGSGMKGQDIKKMTDKDMENIFDDPYLQLSGKVSLSIIHHQAKLITVLEKEILKKECLDPKFQKLTTIPGIGKAIALTISLEVGDLSRFANEGNYLSYCRCVDSKRLFNNKIKGRNNTRCGNPYLCWAYVEAANFTKRFCPYAKAYFDAKFKESRIYTLAIKCLASKIARASYIIMTRGVDYDPGKIFENYKAQALIEKKGHDSKP